MTWDSEAEVYTEVVPLRVRRWRARQAILFDITAERSRQVRKWGEQRHPDGTGPCDPFLDTGRSYGSLSDFARHACDLAAQLNEGTWADILAEEVFEALAEEDQVKLRKELVQVAAVCVAWVEDIDARA